MALTDVQSPNAAADVVAVFDASFNQVFENARAIKASIREESKTMEHPVETGSTITDHRVKLPTIIELSVVLKSDGYQDTFQQIKDVYNRADLLTVQTRTGSYANMLIQSIPHDETPDMFDTVAVAITLKEVAFVTPAFAAYKVADPKHSNKTKRGEQQGKEVSDQGKKGSVLSRLFK